MTRPKNIIELKKAIATDRKKVHPNQIILTFGDEETVDYVKKICRRKGIVLEEYILDNFEWDSPLQCMNDEDVKVDCSGCDYIDRCPDALG